MIYKSLYFYLSLFCLSNLSAQREDIYDVSWSKDKYIMASTGGLLVIDYFLDQRKTMLTEAEIANLDPSGIWGFDQSALDNYSPNAAAVSDRFRDGIVLVPFALLFSSGARSEMADIGFMYLETFAVTSAITSGVKSLAGRKRPFVYNLEAPLAEKQENNANRSFYSGHTSHVASLSFFTASVFSDLYPDSNYRYLVWAGAAIAPAITAYTRYKAGKHFPTDVIVGYGIGATLGYLIPKFHLKSRKNDTVRMSFDGSGLSLTIALK